MSGRARILSSVSRTYVALGAALMLMSSSGLHAQPQGPAKVERAAPVIAKGYFQEFNQSVCNLHYCITDFTAAPVGQMLIITHVACYVLGGGSAALTAHYVSGYFIDAQLAPTLIGVVSGTRHFQSSNSVLLFVQANTKPSVTVAWASTTSTTIACKIAGRIKPV